MIAVEGRRTLAKATGLTVNHTKLHDPGHLALGLHLLCQTAPKLMFPKVWLKSRYVRIDVAPIPMAEGVCNSSSNIYNRLVYARKCCFLRP